MLNFFARSGRKIENIDSLCPGRGQARLARAGEGSVHAVAYLHPGCAPRLQSLSLPISRSLALSGRGSRRGSLLAARDGRTLSALAGRGPRSRSVVRCAPAPRPWLSSSQPAGAALVCGNCDSGHGYKVFRTLIKTYKGLNKSYKEIISAGGRVGKWGMCLTTREAAQRGRGELHTLPTPSWCPGQSRAALFLVPCLLAGVFAYKILWAGR